jgi:RNA polymerase sigma factor (sigma-70 family)
MTYANPFAETVTTDTDDAALAQRAQQGSREALGALLSRHQRWVYNLAVRMLYYPEDAEDATQEILIKVMTRLSTFEGRSSFRTWLYRMVVNHLLNMKRGRSDPPNLTFPEYGRGLDAVIDADLPDQSAAPPDIQLLIDEARIGCTTGMLLCFSRDQRLVYILGEIFSISAVLGAELLDITPENFRQKLSRARRDLHNFMQDKCGLVNASNPCRCARKTQGFIKSGYLNPANLLFARERIVRIREAAAKASEQITSLDEAYAAVFREHPFHDSPRFVNSLKELLDRGDFRAILDSD